MRHLFALTLILTSLTIRAATPGQAQELEGLPGGTQEAEVEAYLDGDKILVITGGKEHELNFIGADAPEPGECHAKESSAAIKRILKVGDTVHLEKDGKDKDGKGRLLRYVWAADKTGEKAYLVNTKLVRDGLAGFQSKDDGNDKYNARLKKAQEQAKEKGSGIWGECGGPHEDAPAVTEVPREGFGLSGTDDVSKITSIKAGTYSTEAYCDNTAMQVYIFDLAENLVAWPVSRSRLNEDAVPEIIIPVDGDYEIEVYCTGDWFVRFTLKS